MKTSLAVVVVWFRLSHRKSSRSHNEVNRAVPMKRNGMEGKQSDKTMAHTHRLNAK